MVEWLLSRFTRWSGDAGASRSGVRSRCPGSRTQPTTIISALRRRGVSIQLREGPDGSRMLEVSDAACGAAQFRARDERCASGVAAAPICAGVKARADV